MAASGLKDGGMKGGGSSGGARAIDERHQRRGMNGGAFTRSGCRKWFRVPARCLHPAPVR